MKNLILPFLYTLFLALSLPTLLPQLHIFYFAPLIVISFYHIPKLSALRVALLCGWIVDLLSASTPFGFYALVYTIVAFLLYPMRLYFFEDSLSTWPIMTALFSVGVAIVSVCVAWILGEGIALSWGWFRADLFGMPLVDAAYAFVAFTLPAWLLPRRHTRRVPTRYVRYAKSR